MARMDFSTCKRQAMRILERATQYVKVPTIDSTSTIDSNVFTAVLILGDLAALWPTHITTAVPHTRTYCSTSLERN